MSPQTRPNPETNEALASISPWVAAGWVLAGALLFSWPAIWNGFPLFFYDSGDYLASSFSLQPAIYRTLPYSLFLRLSHGGVCLWGSIAAQALSLSYLLVELMGACGVLGRPRRMAFILLAIGLGSALPWFASQIMPDAFTGAMVAGLGLLGLAPLSPPRLCLVAAITLTAIAAHASHFPTALALSLLFVLLRIWRGRLLPRARLALPVIVTVAGIALTPVAHYLATGDFFLSRSAPLMALARLIRDGEAQRYLAQACPTRPLLRLCAFVDQLPSGWNGANDFLWGRGSAFDQLGGWNNWRLLGEEGRAIVRGAWATFPGANLTAALRDWGQQLVTFGSGSGLGAGIWQDSPLQATIEGLFPASQPALTAARQFQTDLTLAGWSRVHKVVLTLAMLGALPLLLHPRQRDRRWALLVTVAVATLTNSGVTAIFSNPDDRYQARLIWLFIPLVLAIFGPSANGLPPEAGPGSTDSPTNG